MSQQVDISKVIVCPDCDILFEKTYATPGKILSCTRCGHTLHAPQEDSIEKTLALSIAGLLLFIPANFMSIMTLNILGTEGSGSVYDGIIAFIDTGYPFVAVMVALTSLVFPFVKLSLIFLVSLFLKLKKYPATLKNMMRWHHHLDEWGMLEVYMVGILISIIKLYHMAHIHYDMGFFCFIGLMFIAISSSSAMDEHLFWELIEANSASD